VLPVPRVLTIKQARAELKRVGTAHAQGDALRFMFANLLAFEHHLSAPVANSIKWPIPLLYAALGRVSTDEIWSEFKRLRGDLQATLALLD